MNVATRQLAMAGVLIALLASIVAAGVATARPGDLDPTFGDGGRVFVDVASDSDAATTVLLQPDGKIVVGRWNDATNDDFSVLRFNEDGSPDATFDGDGRSTLDLPAHKGATLVVLLQADDKIVAAGTIQNTADSRTMLGLARYNADGSVDTGFGAGGVVIHDLGGCCDQISSIVQQADGRLVAAGTTDGGVTATPDMAFVRFNPDGSLDRSFGENGAVIINFHESNGHDSVRWLVQHPDGTLIATGVATPSNPYSHEDMPIVRLLPDGLPDPTLDGDGRVTIELNDPSGQGVGNIAEAAWLASEADGRIVVVGKGNRNVWDYGNDTPLIARVNSDGSPDPTFGDGGTAWIGLHGAYLQGLVIEPNGPIYLAGDYFNDHFVSRVTRTGALDASFGLDGVAIIDSGDGNEAPNAGFASLVRQHDGKIVTVSSTTASDVSPGSERIVVARLLISETGGHPGLLGFHGPVRSEENEVVSVRFRRTGGSSGAVSVDYATASGSATSGADFTAADGTMSWSDGDTADKRFEISIAADGIDEGSESFAIELSNPSGGAMLAATELTVQITDKTDSGPPPDTSSGGGSGGGAIDLICLASMILLILVTPFRSRISPRLRETRSCLRPIACPLELPGLTDRADEFLVRKPDKFFLRLRPRMATPRTRDDKKRRTHEASAGGGRGGRTRKPTRTCASVTDSASPWANTFAINMSRGIPMSCALASSKSSRSIAWVVQSTSPSTWTGQNQRRSLPHRRGLRSPVCAGGGLSTVMYPRRYGGRAAFQRSTAPTPW